ncbi:TPA: hypothetical protein ACP9DH_003320 [Legionella anisa]
MTFLFTHMPLLIASFVILLGILLLVGARYQHNKIKHLLGTTGFLLSFFGFVAITAILYLTYFPRLR